MTTIPYRLAIITIALAFGFQAAALEIRCVFTSRTLDEFLICMEPYTIPEGYFTTDSSCLASQLTTAQRTSWETAVTSLLTIGCPLPAGTGGEVVPGQPYVVDVPGLPGYSVSRIATEEPGAGGGHPAWCVLSEHTAHLPQGFSDPMYVSGWGFAIVPATADRVLRNLHFSAPHPGRDSDRGTPKQAAVLFGKTGAKSVVIAGRHRGACTKKTDCSSAEPGNTYYESDGSHDNSESFHLAVAQVVAWQNAHGGCPWKSCAYLQFHGNNNAECDAVFLSSGRGHSSTSCYADKKLPINQIKEQLDLVWSETHNIPHLDPSGMEGKCIFTATRNILARLVGGFDASTICLDTLPSTVDKNIHCCGDAIGCLGSFVQIEQNSLSRDAGRYNDWAAAINKAFPI